MTQSLYYNVHYHHLPRAIFFLLPPPSALQVTSHFPQPVRETRQICKLVILQFSPSFYSRFSKANILSALLSAIPSVELCS
jgi:uncharacterized protein YecE (DUF72 family)